MKLLSVIGLAAIVTIAGIDAAFACACCSFVGQRSDSVQKIDGRISAQLEMMNFRREARISAGERDDAIPGLADRPEVFTVTVTRLKDRLTFSFVDGKGRTGTLALVKPQTITLFEVDPRDGPDHGTGPSLYKEWRITTPSAGDGLFRRSVVPGGRITLVMHGRGNSCTDAHNFTHWTLVVRGRGFLGFSLYGELTTDAVK